MDKKTNDLMEKCNTEDGSVMDSCKVMLEIMAKKDVELEDKSDETYLMMAENLSPKDIPKVLELALKVRESGEIKDTELKNAASKLIRAIEMS
ncbi:MAG: hypothetical protein ACLPWD_00740 [Methanobacterium sp.]